MDHGLEGAAGGAVEDKDDDDDINISDVIEVIETDLEDVKQTSPTKMFSGGEIRKAPNRMNVTTTRQHQLNSMPVQRGAYVRILEQPASKALRFRYECEGRSAGSIPGTSSTPENKTYPTIQVVGYRGPAVVVVSCVTKEQPYRPHPHNLVGREGCRKGVCTLDIPTETMTVTFSNLGIQCVKKKDIEDALKLREGIRVDPYKTGFSHRNQPTSIDLNAVRLCFQVFVDGETGKVPLPPIVSDPIYDKKAMSDLAIVELSDCTCSVAGGKKIMLFCEKVAKEDIQVHFYEESNGAIIWEGLGDFQPTHVHKQVGIAFRTPRYRTLDVSEPVKVFMQLRRPSDGATSDPLPFEYVPLDSDPETLKRKRQKLGNDPNNYIVRHLQEQEKARNRLQPPPYTYNIQDETTVKVEPRDTSPSPYGGQMYASNLSPIYNPQVWTPQGQYLSPMEMQQQQQQQQSYSNMQPMQPQPATSPYMVVAQTWPQDIPLTDGASAVAAAFNNAVMETPTGLSSVLDLDSHELTQLNSSELHLLETNLAADLTNNLSLTDLKTEEIPKNIVTGNNNEENMTDSFTATLNNICNLNNMYKPNIKE